MPLNTVCECGCEQVTVGIRNFLPGHAVRHAAVLRRRASNGDVQAFQELYARGWNINKGPGALSFGVEAEFFGIDRETAVYVLRDAGLEADDDGYHHHAKPYWRVTDDGSVSNEGNELVSPILKVGEKHFTDTKKAVSSLNHAGGQVDRSCGLHVHHSVKGKDVKDIAETVAHYSLFQPLINQILPPSRHDAGFARAMFDATRWYNQVLRRDTMSQLIQEGYQFGRYHAINLQALGDHRTLEFRQHSGTLNHKKVTNWVRFTRALMDIAKFSSYESLVAAYGGRDSVATSLGLSGMLDLLMLPEDTKQFYLDRAAQLGNGGDTEDQDAEQTADSPYEDGESDGDGNIWCSECNTWHEDETWNDERGYDEEPIF